MKHSIFFSLALLFTLVLFTSASNAQSNGKGDGTKTGGNPNAPHVNWVDANGDGICDNFGTPNQGSGAGKGKKDGTGNGTKQNQGKGFGKNGGNGTGTGTGVCDGTGPKGKCNRGGRK